MEYSYNTRGTCAVKIDFSLDENNKIHNVSFLGGCNGNLKAISKLIEGLPAEEVMEKLQGLTCGSKYTSCGDQLACAIEEALKKNK